MKQLSSIIFFLFNFYAPALLASSNSQFYSVADVINSIQESDINAHRLLSFTPPDVLYHWLSISSALRLFKGYNSANRFPMKKFGDAVSQSILSSKVSQLNEKEGLFVWHNPVGAATGGSGELYGNHEAVLALKIDPNVRVGLIVTSEEHDSELTKLQDDRVVKNYDLILHVTGLILNDRFTSGYIEWVILNPEIITEFTLDAKLIAVEMKKYQDALKDYKSKGKTPVIKKIAGPQHSGLGEFGINSDSIEDLVNKINQHSKKLKSLQFAQGWHLRTNNCQNVIGHYK